MAGIQKRVRASGTVTYVVRWYAPDGAERSKGGFRTRKDAKAQAALKAARQWEEKAKTLIRSSPNFEPIPSRLSRRLVLTKRLR